MPITDYFSKYPNKRARFIFDIIAPVYGMLDAGLIKNYSHSISIVDTEIGIRGKHVLDIGTGTGAWAEMFRMKGAAKVHGIDFSDKMLEVSRKKHADISFTSGDAEDLFDIHHYHYRFLIGQHLSYSQFHFGKLQIHFYCGILYFYLCNWIIVP